MARSTGTPVPLKWTISHFHQLSDFGGYVGRRAELIVGMILKQGPMNSPHTIVGEKLEVVIRLAFGTGCRIRFRNQLVFGAEADPEPDH